MIGGKWTIGCNCCGESCNCFKYAEGFFNLHMHFNSEGRRNNEVYDYTFEQGFRYTLARISETSPFWVSSQLTPQRVGLFVPKSGEDNAGVVKPRVVIWDNDATRPPNLASDYANLGSHTGVIYECQPSTVITLRSTLAGFTISIKNVTFTAGTDFSISDDDNADAASLAEALNTEFGEGFCTARNNQVHIRKTIEALNAMSGDNDIVSLSTQTYHIRFFSDITEEMIENPHLEVAYNIQLNGITFYAATAQNNIAREYDITGDLASDRDNLIECIHAQPEFADYFFEVSDNPIEPNIIKMYPAKTGLGLIGAQGQILKLETSWLIKFNSIAQGTGVLIRTVGSNGITSDLLPLVYGEDFNTIEEFVDAVNELEEVLATYDGDTVILTPTKYNNVGRAARVDVSFDIQDTVIKQVDWTIIQGNELDWPTEPPAMRRLNNTIEGITNWGITVTSRSRVPLNFQCQPSIMPAERILSFDSWVDSPVDLTIPTDNYTRWVSAYERSALNQYQGIGLGIPDTVGHIAQGNGFGLRQMRYNHWGTYGGGGPLSEGYAITNIIVFGVFLASEPRYIPYNPFHAYYAGTMFWLPEVFVTFPLDGQGEASIVIYMYEYILNAYDADAAGDIRPLVYFTGPLALGNRQPPIKHLQTYRWTVHFNPFSYIGARLAGGVYPPNTIFSNDIGQPGLNSQNTYDKLVTSFLSPKVKMGNVTLDLN